MQNKTRREERRDATLQEIKDRAWQQMAENGPGGISLREISRQMRMSSAALFRYFPSRDQLLSALTAEAFDQLGQATEAAIRSQSEGAQASPRHQLTAAARAYREWALANPQRYALIFGAPIPGFQPDWERLAPFAGRSLLAIMQVFEAALQSGALPAAGVLTPAPLVESLRHLIEQRQYTISPAALYLGVIAWSRIHGLVSLELLGQLQTLVGEPDALFEHELALMLEQWHL